MKRFLPLILICVVFLIVGIATLHDYGMNEDSPGHFIRGQSYIQRITTGDYFYNQPNLPSPLLFVPGQRISLYKLNSFENNLSPVRPIASYVGQPTTQQIFSRYHDIYGRESIYKNNAWSTTFSTLDDGGHPPISDMLESLSNKLFYEVLGWVGDIEGYHVYIVFAATLGLFFIGYFAYVVWGMEASLLSMLTLGLYPFFFAESHFNIKDIPEMSFFAISIISFYFWVTAHKKRWFGIFLFSTFFAIGTKLNSAFLPFILVPWLLTLYKTSVFRKWMRPTLFLYAGIFFVSICVLLVSLWPYLWENTFEKLFNIFNFYAQVSSVDTNIQVASRFVLPFGIDLRGILYILFQTPLAALVLFIGGIWGIVLFFIKHQQKHFFPFNEEWLLLFWLGIPIVRVLRPGADVFGSMRQYAEFLPALALLCGIGGAWLIVILSKYSHVSKKLVTIGVVGLYAVLLIWNIIVYHPNENIFFNSLIGGPKGASAVGLLDWQANYDQPYRQAVNWLNTHAEQNARLAYLDGTMVAIPSIWLRGDIHFGSFFSGFGQKGEYIASIVYPHPPEVFPYLYLERFLQPVYTVEVQGVPVLQVWKNSPEHVRDDMKNQHTVAIPATQKGRDNLAPYWEIDFPKSYQITSLTLKSSDQKCLRRDGLFALDQYFVPLRQDIDATTTVFYFPAESTQRIRFYSIVNTCFSTAKIQEITAL